MKKDSQLFVSIGMIVLGVLFVVKKSSVIHTAIMLIAAVLLLSAILDFIKKESGSGVVKAVLAIGIAVFGWMFVGLALYLVGILLILHGVTQLVQNAKGKSGGNLAYAIPVFSLIAGCCLLFNQGGTVNWIFVVAGLILIVEGVLSLTRS